MTLHVSNSLGVGILDPLPRENIGWWVEVYDFESHNTLLARLYRTKFSFSVPLGDTGAFQLAMAQNDPVFDALLPTGEAGSELLTQPHWFAMVDEGIPRFRGYLDGINKDKVTTDGVRLYTLSGPGIAGCIGWGVALPIDPTGSADRTFADTTWASVFTTLFLEAQERGAIPDWLTLRFTGSKDTYDQSWTDVGDHTVPAGTNLLEMLKQFSETYGFEWYVTQAGDVIAASRIGQDRAQEVRFFESTTVVTATDVEDRKDMTTDIFVADSEGAVTEVSDPAAILAYGRREVWVTQGEITGTAARSNVGNTLLLAGKEPLKSRTFKVPFNHLDPVSRTSTGRRCFVDYVLGDTIGYGPRFTADDDYRVVEIAIGVDGSTELELTLTSRRQRDLEKLNRLIKRILSGQTGTGAGAGATSVTSTINVALSSINLEDLYNVENFHATGGEYLRFDGTKGRWIAQELGPLDDHTDVEIDPASLQDADVLTYDIGLGQWRNASVGSGAFSFVPLSRRVDTSGGITGGGQLDADLTLSLDTEAVQDLVGAMVQNGIAYDDPTGKIALDAEYVQDFIASFLVGSGITLTYDDPGGTLTVSPATRQTTNKTTASLAVNASEDDTVTLAPAYRILSVTVDRACRVRLYTTASARAADAARAPGTDPTGDHGVMLDLVFTASGTLTMSPLVDGFVPSSSNVPYSIQNTSAGTAAVSVDFTWVRTE